jgi:glyoxylase-like metal-dependent hydrolase (beta-lactamase superfamily II)/alkylhydroperoxidase family enzyme
MSNSGLVLDGDTALLIDTQFDLPHARTMLDALADQVPNARIDVLVNTHADGDHTWGNQLVPGAQLTVSTDTAKEMAVAPTPADLLALLELPTGDPLGDYMTDLNQPFDFTGITPPSPAREFTGTLEIAVGGTGAHAMQLGPAHTGGDTVVWVPDDGVLFAGDLLFVGVHPVMWSGPIEGWIEACKRMEALQPSIVVPGHGPITDATGLAEFRRYLEHLQTETDRRFDQGMSWQDAAADIPPFNPALANPERVAVTVATIYRERGGDAPSGFNTVMTTVANLANGTLRRPRLAPLPAQDIAENARQALNAGNSTGALADHLRNAPPLNILATLARHPDLFATWMPLAWQLSNGVLPAADREIVILRTALRCGARYEWDQHAPVAGAVGLLSSDLAAIVRGPDDGHWAQPQRALLRLVDELHATATVSDELWQDLAAHYDERQLIELIMLVGHYHEVAFALNALRVPADAWIGASTFPGIPAS